MFYDRPGTAAWRFSATIENELKPAPLVDFRLEASRTEFKLSHAPIGRYLLA